MATGTGMAPVMKEARWAIRLTDNAVLHNGTGARLYPLNVGAANGDTTDRA
ncbi:MAG: hypothetical protein JJT90_04375 [Ectothiorhodospiraceae bacterium]|nr:hypothetical protein [Ectothiorhodospiraceae bacterium]